MPEPTRIEWTSNLDKCVAEVGKVMKWGRPDKATGQVRSWSTGARVLKIHNAESWVVDLDPADHPGPWHHRITCGAGAKVFFD